MHTFLYNYSFLAKNYIIKYTVVWIQCVMFFCVCVCVWGGRKKKTFEQTHNNQPMNHKNGVNYNVGTTVRFRLTNTVSEHCFSQK